MHPAGLDEDGFIAREGDLTRVPEAFRPVVQAAKTDILPRWRDRLSAAPTDASLCALSRGVGRRLTRTGFTLVMPRWGGWTSDLAESAAVFGRYYPARADQMNTAAAIGRTPTADRAILSMLIDDLGP